MYYNHPQYNKNLLLIIDDNKDIGTILEKILGIHYPQLKIVRCENASQTLAFIDECLQNNQPLPHLILQDLHMPMFRDGLTLLKDLRERVPRGTMLPIVIHSSTETKEEIVEVYQAGGTSFFAKRIDYNQWVDDFAILYKYWWNVITLPDRVVV